MGGGIWKKKPQTGGAKGAPGEGKGDVAGNSWEHRKGKEEQGGPHGGWCFS